MEMTVQQPTIRPIPNTGIARGAPTIRRFKTTPQTVSTHIAVASDEYKLKVWIADVEKYGFKGLNTTESIWGYPTNITLNGTALNITAYYIDVYPYYGRDWIDPETNEKPYNDWNSMTYWYNNQIYNIAQIEGQQSLGQCQPDGVSPEYHTLQGDQPG